MNTTPPFNRKSGARKPGRASPCTYGGSRWLGMSASLGLLWSRHGDDRVGETPVDPEIGIVVRHAQLVLGVVVPVDQVQETQRGRGRRTRGPLPAGCRHRADALRSARAPGSRHGSGLTDEGRAGRPSPHPRARTSSRPASGGSGARRAIRPPSRSGWPGPCPAVRATTPSARARRRCPGGPRARRAQPRQRRRCWLRGRSRARACEGTRGYGPGRSPQGWASRTVAPSRAEVTVSPLAPTSPAARSSIRSSMSSSWDGSWWNSTRCAAPDFSARSTAKSTVE